MLFRSGAAGSDKDGDPPFRRGTARADRGAPMAAVAPHRRFHPGGRGYRLIVRVRRSPSGASAVGRHNNLSSPRVLESVCLAFLSLELRAGRWGRLPGRTRERESRNFTECAARLAGRASVTWRGGSPTKGRTIRSGEGPRSACGRSPIGSGVPATARCRFARLPGGFEETRPPAAVSTRALRNKKGRNIRHGQALSLVGDIGLEPMTSSLSSWRSSQLN